MTSAAENKHWSMPPDSLSISDNEVHIWRAVNYQHPEAISLCELLLTYDENSKAKRYVNDVDRIRFIVGRGGLKLILSRYINMKPEEIILLFDESGKPFLDDRCNKGRITFNLSHSGDSIVYGISKNKDIGIDVEKIREIDSMDDLIQEYFSYNEQKYFQSIDAPDKKRAFFSCWTRKEAYIKARGKGLSYPLDGFSVSIDPNEDARLESDDYNDISCWSMKEIISTPEYIGAVAVRGNNLAYFYFKYDVSASLIR